MPCRNVLKEWAPESYYHVYARGGSKKPIFIDAADYRYFTNLFERYLSKKVVISKAGESYPNYREMIQLNAYCLMKNHFHLLIYQGDLPYLEKFMRSVMTSYSRYFNLRHGRTGSLFESRYKAVRIDADPYLLHISRYIHLNPRYWENYFNSSLKFYRGGDEPEWLTTSSILDLFNSRKDYIEFVTDFEENRDMMNELKYQLADL